MQTLQIKIERNLNKLSYELILDNGSGGEMERISVGWSHFSILTNIAGVNGAHEISRIITGTDNETQAGIFNFGASGCEFKLGAFETDFYVPKLPAKGSMKEAEESLDKWFSFVKNVKEKVKGWNETGSEAKTIKYAF